MEKWTSAQWAEVGHIILSLRFHCTDMETDKLFIFFPIYCFSDIFQGILSYLEKWFGSV